MQIMKTVKTLEIGFPLKYLSIFQRFIDIPLINCEVSIILTWSQNCVSTNITRQTSRVAQ